MARARYQVRGLHSSALLARTLVEVGAENGFFSQLLRSSERRGLTRIEAIRELIDDDPLGTKDILLKTYAYVGGYSDLTWHLFHVDDTPAEMLQKREQMKMYLARYGRQSIFEWDDRTPEDLQAAGQALAAVLKEEKEAMSPMNENNT